MKEGNKMEDCYKIIGTSKDAIYCMKLKHLSEEEIDRFIKEKYEDTKKRLERKISVTTLPDNNNLNRLRMLIKK